MPSKQETFDTMRKHLLRQKLRSTDGTTDDAVYIGADGRLDPVVSLLPNIPRADFEECPYDCDEDPVKAWLEDAGHDVDVAYAVQDIHDCYDPEDWEDRLKDLAEELELKFKPAGQLMEPTTAGWEVIA